MQGTLEMGRNRTGLGNENCYHEKYKRQDNTGFYCDSFSLSFCGSFGRKYCFTVYVRKKKFSHFHIFHFKNCLSAREIMDLKLSEVLRWPHG